MPITLGILAQSRQEAAGATFQLLESTVLTSTQASVEFTNLTTKYASTYQHLQIRFTARQAGGTGFNSTGIIRFNGDTASNYNFQALYSTSGSVASDAGYSSSSINWWLANENSVSNAFGAGVIDFLDPFETTKNKTVRMLDGAFQTNTNFQRFIAIRGGSWRNTASVTSIQFGVTSEVMAIGSRISLYGIKATA
jgi:hypothetical protein